MIILTWAVNCLQQGIQVKLEPLYQGAFPSPWVLDTWMTGWTGSRLPGAGLGLSRLAGFTSWTIFCGDISVLKFKGKSIRFFKKIPQFFLEIIILLKIKFIFFFSKWEVVIYWLKKDLQQSSFSSILVWYRLLYELQDAGFWRPKLTSNT